MRWPSIAPGSPGLHAEDVARPEPVCADLLSAEVARPTGARRRTSARAVRAVGDPCIGAEQDDAYDARHMIELPLAGLRT